jgi:DNA-binding CsgD family transcriptional regulator
MLVGRVAECARVDRFVAGLFDRRSGGLLIAGDAGAGKTAPLTYARERAGSIRTLAVRGFEAERDLPYAGLSLLLRPVQRQLEHVPEAQRAALEAALGLGPPVAADRFAAYAGVLSALAAAAEAGPLLVLVDDAQWLDAASFEALLFTARRLLDEGIGMLFAARDDERPAGAFAGLPRLELHGLDQEDVAALVERRARIRPSPDVVGQIHGATGGNPLAVGELAAALSRAQLDGSVALEDPLPVGADIERAVGRRLLSLPAETRRALLFAAAEPTAGPAALERALDGPALESALAPAESASLITVGPDAVEFRHPLFRSVAYQLAGAPERRAAHAALARTFDPEAARARRAWHLARAASGVDEVVARELEAVGRSARDRGAPEAAGRALETAARLTPPLELRMRRRLDAARAFGMAARLEAARRLLDDILAEAPDDPCLRADVQRLRARLETMTGGSRQWHETLAGEAERVLRYDSERAASLLTDAAFIAATDGQPRLTLELATRAQSLGTALDELTQLEVDQTLGGALVLTGRIEEGLEHLKRAEQLLERDDVLVDFMAIVLAQAYYWAGHYEHSRGILRPIVDRARRQGVVAALPTALALMAWLDFRLGDWTRAYGEVSESLSLAAAVGQSAQRAFGLMRLAELEAGRRAARECRAHVQESLAIAEKLGVGAIQLMAGPVLGLLAAGCGPTDDTVDRLESTGRACLERGLEEPMTVPWTQELTETYLRLGDWDGAERTLAVLERQARRAGQRSATAAACRYRGLLVEDADEAERLFLRAIQLHDTLPLPFDRARTELCFGERLRRYGRRVQARAHLQAALDTFERLTARPWADRARRELVATGLRARRRVPETGNELTAQELQVALLVGEGATNREAAAQLYVSPKTIETHLSRIYRKLGVRSRTELARHPDLASAQAAKAPVV